jgi:predicted DNA-binding protein
MPLLTISLLDEPMARLQELAHKAGATPEELVQASVEKWLSKQKEDFTHAAEYVLEKNAELYQRLAGCDT